MSKEELEKEAEKYISMKQKPITKYDLIAFAEPREKRITELKKQIDLKEKALSKAKKETKRIADRVNKDKRRLIRRKTELEAQIEKMKCCANCMWEPPFDKHCDNCIQGVIKLKYRNWKLGEIKENDKRRT